MEKKEEYIRGDQFLFANSVLAVKEVSTGKFILSFKKQFGVKPGQVVALTSDRNLEPRIYSLCSGTEDSQMQILFDLKNDGKLTPALSQLQQGERIYVSKPYGSFSPTNDTPMWWIATGTGIAPFHSMIRSGYRAEKLLHGARFSSHFYFEREFKTLLKENYLRCNTGNDGIGDYFGRVTHYLQNFDTLPKNIKYYLCGRPLMVVEVRDLLISKGVPYENIISEIFF
jgi:ferredoxin/flavodoxin---NADP+ reductase